MIGKELFFSGRKLTLIHSVLSGLPIYFLSLFRIPAIVALRLEKLMRDFLWEEFEEKRSFHLIKWDVVYRSKKKGGLSIGNLVKRN